MTAKKYCVRGGTSHQWAMLPGTELQCDDPRTRAAKFRCGLCGRELYRAWRVGR